MTLLYYIIFDIYLYIIGKTSIRNVFPCGILWSEVWRPRSTRIYLQGAHIDKIARDIQSTSGAFTKIVQLLFYYLSKCPI